MRKKKETDRGRHPKRKTSLMKLNFCNCNFISCNFQILENFYIKGFPGVKLEEPARNK